jgi:hypothetical protein
VDTGVEEHQHSLVLQAQEVGLFAQRYGVDQPGTQTEGQGNSGDGLHYKQAQVDLGWWKGGSKPTALSPSPQRGAFAQHGARIRQDKTAGAASFVVVFVGEAIYFPVLLPAPHWGVGG